MSDTEHFCMETIQHNFRKRLFEKSSGGIVSSSLPLSMTGEIGGVSLLPVLLFSR